MDNKIKEYFRLQLSMISWPGYLVALVCGGVAALLRHKIYTDSLGFINPVGFTSDILIVFAVAFLMPYIDKICSATLFQKEAYFYQSFPVSEKGTVISKTLVIGLLVMMLPAGFFLTEIFLTKRHNPLLILAFVAAMLAIGFLVAGIIIAGYSIGNNFRNQKKGVPNKVVSTLFIVIVTLLLLLIWKVIKKIQILSFEGQIFLAAIVLALLGIIFLLGNISSIKHNYEI